MSSTTTTKTSRSEQAADVEPVTQRVPVPEIVRRAATTMPEPQPAGDDAPVTKPSGELPEPSDRYLNWDDDQTPN